jgi:dipeptidyl aminopeptidase/acylaminoacyl peptidase
MPDAPLTQHSPALELMKTVMPGIDELIDQGIADADNIGIVGHSFGGFSTLSLITQSQRFKAAVAVSGTSDLMSFYGVLWGSVADYDWAEKGQGQMGGSPWEFPERYIENSPIWHLDRVTTPLLLIHGAMDSRVPVAQSDEVFAGLERLGKEATYVRYAKEDHVIERPAAVVDFMNRMLQWFDSRLKGDRKGPD